MLVVLDREQLFLLSGAGDLIEPDDGVVGIGSGGPFAVAAARAGEAARSIRARSRWKR